MLLVAGTPIDCADPGACKIGAGAVRRPGISADYPIQFDLSIPPPPPPTLSVTPSTNLLNGQTVAVTGTSYPANTMVALLECLDPPSSDPFNCGYEHRLQYTMSDVVREHLVRLRGVRRMLRINGHLDRLRHGRVRASSCWA